MTASWPAGLPQFVLAGAQENLTASVIETASSMLTAAVRKRRRVLGQWRSFSVAIFCAPEQLESFETFYHTTLAGGVLPFTWVHPRTREAGAFRFNGPPPSIAPLGTNDDGVFASVSFKLVRLT